MSRGRLAAGAVVLVTVAAAAYLVPLVFFKPWTLDQFYARLFLEFVLRRPMLLSQLHILEPLGIDFHNDELDDLSLEFQRREVDWVARQLRLLRRFDRQRLAAADQLTYDVLEWFLDDVVRGRPFIADDYPVNPVNGIQSSLPQFLLTGHRIDNLEHAGDYVARVGRLPRALAQARDGLEQRRRQGVILPLPLLLATVREMEEFVAVAPERHPLYLHLELRLRELGALPRTGDRLLARLRDEIADGVYPAYRGLIDQLRELEADSPEEAGAWRLADGDAYYSYALEHHATKPVSAAALHRLGLAEVARLENEMRQSLERLELPADQPGSAVRRLAAEERFLYPDDDDGRRRILADARAILEEMDARLDELVARRPPVGVRVEAVPEAEESGAPRAYYQPPPPDRSRPGVFFLNLRELAGLPRFRLRTLAYHEAIPGHHYQSTQATAASAGPLFRGLLPFTAFVEGWALYAERLAAEHGFFEDPYDRLGQLEAELFRTARLVTDTGIHQARWSRERATSYLSAVTGLARPEALAEIDRQIVSPGQACASQIGQLTLLELRRRARERLGDRFDIRQFHTTLLRDGALPLALLEARMETWIERELGAGRP